MNEENVLKACQELVALPIFEQMRIAGEVLAEHKATFPEHEQLIDNAYMLMQPTQILQESTEVVFRSHCEEICQRVLNGKDTRPGTNAEILMVLSRTSLLAPLKQDPAAAFQLVFDNVYGTEARTELFLINGNPGSIVGESFPGAVDEVIGIAKRKLTNPGRRYNE